LFLFLSEPLTLPSEAYGVGGAKEVFFDYRISLIREEGLEREWFFIGYFG